MKISCVEDMRTLDAIATEKYGISSDILMENAGEATYFVISKELKLKGKKFLIFCGSGNNGGDGLVVARKIHSNGGKVEILLLESEDKFKGSAKKNFEIVSKIGIEIRKVGNIEDVKEEIEKSDAIIDAIFGTGLSRNVEGVYKEVIKLINDGNKPVFSIDIPSGVNGNNGKIMGMAIEASYTVTFGLPKLGNIFYPGYEHCGKLYVSHISFPPSIYEHLEIEINEPLKIPERKKDGHKGDFGDVLFVAGSAGYPGAPYLSSMSFLKTGGGYSRLATPKSIIPYIANNGCEIVFVSMEETKSGSIALKNEDKILELIKKADMVVLGSGLSLNEETQELVRELAKEVNKPILIDGDGLTAISKALDVIKNRKKETILTPHLGEMSKITKKTVKELDENKIEMLRKTSEEMRAIIVLKGARSLIGYPDGKAYINMSGNCGMATAGSGDVLTGTIAAMFGLGLNIGDAVRTGVFIHGLSGDLASLDRGEDGTTALDIMDYLPSAMKHYREKLDKIKEKYNLQII
jgi:hydroxyethylthiazole kinase-like uncharacterized protein yjeF